MGGGQILKSGTFLQPKGEMANLRIYVRLTDTELEGMFDIGHRQTRLLCYGLSGAAVLYYYFCLIDGNT